jgi:hypothetical protein
LTDPGAPENRIGEAAKQLRIAAEDAELHERQQRAADGLARTAAALAESIILFRRVELEDVDVDDDQLITDGGYAPNLAPNDDDLEGPVCRCFGCESRRREGSRYCPDHRQLEDRADRDPDLRADGGLHSAPESGCNCRHLPDEATCIYCRRGGRDSGRVLVTDGGTLAAAGRCVRCADRGRDVDGEEEHPKTGEPLCSDCYDRAVCAQAAELAEALEEIDWSSVPTVSAATAATFAQELARAEGRL